MRRLRAVVRFATSEARHLRVDWLALATVAGVVGSAELVRSFYFGTAEEQFVVELGLGVVRAAASFVTVLVPPLLVAHSLRAGTLHLWVAGGVSRGQWLLAYYVAVTGSAFLVIGAGGGALAAIVWRAGGASAIEGLSLELARCVAEASVIAAVGLFAAVVARGPFLAVAIAAGFVVACELAPLIEGMDNRMAGARGAAWTLVSAVLPDFSSHGGASPGIYAIGYLAAAVAVFAHREI